MGGFVTPDENLDYAAARILEQLTSLIDIYLEQLFAFGDPYRDPTERTVSSAYYYKLDKRKYQAKFDSFLNLIPNPHSLK